MYVRNNVRWLRRITGKMNGVRAIAPVRYVKHNSVGSISPVNFDWSRAKWLVTKARQPGKVTLSGLSEQLGLGEYWLPRSLMVYPNWNTVAKPARRHLIKSSHPEIWHRNWR